MLFGPDTMAKGQKEVIYDGMSGRFCGFRVPLAASKSANPNAYQALLRQHVVPGHRGYILAKNMSFGRFSTVPHRQDPPAVVGRILHSGVFATMFTGIESARLLYLACFEGKRPGNDSQQFYTLCLSIAAAWNQLAAVYIHSQKLPYIPPPSASRLYEK
jgi:hypothetical protein